MKAITLKLADFGVSRSGMYCCLGLPIDFA